MPLRTLVHPLFLFAMLAASAPALRAQDLAFRRLSMADGLTDNLTAYPCIDATGALWVGGRSGLNYFDGISVTRYNSRTHPALPSDAVGELTTDRRGRLWIATDKGLAMLDERRTMHRVNIHDSLRGRRIAHCVEVAGVGMVAMGEGRSYLLRDGEKAWQRFDWLDAQPCMKSLARVHRFDATSYLLCTRKSVALLDLARKETRMNLTLRHSDCFRLNTDELLAFPADSFTIHRIGIREGRVLQTYRHLRDDHGSPATSRIYSGTVAADGAVYFSTTTGGLYRFHPTSGKLHHFGHDPARPSTLSTDRLRTVTAHPAGGLAVTSERGVNYTDVRNVSASYQPLFADEAGRTVDEGVMGVAEDHTGALWISTTNRLLRWDRRGAVRTLFVADGNGSVNMLGKPATAADGTVWVPILGKGIAVYRAGGSLIRWFRKGKGSGQIPSRRVRFVQAVGKDWIVAGSEEAGVFRIRTTDGWVDTFAVHPLLKAIRPRRVIDLLAEDSVWWIATSMRGAAWRYDFASKSLTSLTPNDGLLSDRIYGLARDSAGALHVGTFAGLTVFEKGGKFRQYSIATGLHHNRIDAMTTDDRGRVWASNATVLLRYDPRTGRIRQYDERAGVPGCGFSVAGATRLRDGTLVFGMRPGLLFVPKALQDAPEPAPPTVYIFRELPGDGMEVCSPTRAISLSYGDPTITFYFRTSDLMGGSRTAFRYRMEGLDTAWSTPTRTHSIAYKLKSGEYRFRVQASENERDWIDAAASPRLTVSTPLWQRGWVQAGTAAGLLLALYLLLRARVRAVRRRAALRRQVQEARAVSLQQRLELEQVVSYFATSIGAMMSVDEILWDVARNCIARLGFEDCVIYLLDRERSMLNQRAAWGPKTTEENRIVNPMAIPVGSGITGAVAESRQAILVSDTSLDPRYLVDDAVRGSELAVPMLDSAGAVIGVIDSEASAPHFYNERHLLLLTTIAALCADKIEKLQAEQQVRAKEIEVLTIGKDLAHSQLTALRSQMNPHFLFNSLNAIQECVVTGQVDAAYDYLSRFSRLLRLVLRHSEHDFISLQEEVEVTELYLSLEALRFRHQFSYEIFVDPDIDVDEARVPSLLLQPFVENAIWHGLMHKEGKKKLRISFCEEDESLVCVVEDNGIGRTEAARIRASRLAGKRQESVGTRLSRQKLELLQARYGIHARTDTLDLMAADGDAAGTRVIITLPIAF